MKFKQSFVALLTFIFLAAAVAYLYMQSLYVPLGIKVKPVLSLVPSGGISNGQQMAIEFKGGRRIVASCPESLDFDIDGLDAPYGYLEIRNGEWYTAVSVKKFAKKDEVITHIESCLKSVKRTIEEEDETTKSWN